VGLRPGGNLHPGLSEKVGNFDFGSQGRLSETDRDITDDIISISLEKFVRFDHDEYIQITGRAPLDSAFPFARDLESQTSVGPHRNLDREFLALESPSRAVACDTGGIDGLAAPPASRTGSRNAEKSLGKPDLSGSAALTACGRFRTGGTA
jgi:hypothetical protein